MNRTRALEHLGRLEESWGDFEAALARYEEALATGEAALRDAAPTPYNRAYLVGALSRLGLLRERLGRTASAREALDRALATARELGTRQLVAQVLLDRGRLARESGDLDSALASHEEALAARDLRPARARRGARARRARLGRARRGRRGGGARPVRARARIEGGLRARPRSRGRCAPGSRGPARGSGSSARPPSRTTWRWTRSSRCASATLAEARRLGFWRLRQGVFRSAIALRYRLLVDSGAPGTRRERSSSRSRPARARCWT